MDILELNGEPGAYPPSWYLASAASMPTFPTLDGETKTDVCIIGAGYTGLSAALYLAEKGMDVTVIDAQRVGWGASGRNGGQLHSGQRVDQLSLEKMVGMDHAKKLWQLAEDAKQTVKDLVRLYNIDCDLKPGIVDADHRQRFVKETQHYVDHMRKVYDYDQISYLDRDAVSREIGSDVYHGGTLDWGAGHLHPLNFALGLAEAATTLGVKIFEMTKAVSIEEGTPARVVTPRGTIRADTVLMACNGYLGELDERVGRHVMPINSYMIATEPMGEARAKALIPRDVAVADSRFVVNYYRLSADHRMLFGGRESYGYRFPEDIATVTRRRMLSIYPQLADLRIDHAWGGTLGITMNRMPYFARLAPNIITASGFSGHGVAMATMSGRLMAEAISGDTQGFDLMQDVPSPGFPGGMLFQRPLLVLAMFYFAMRDRF